MRRTAQRLTGPLFQRAGTAMGLFGQIHRIMNSTNDIIKGHWKTLKGQLKQEYAKLTDNDLLYLEGKEDELVGRLQKAMGKTKEEVDAIIARLAPGSPV